MAGSLALSGLASGVDTSGIVEKLMAVESQGKTRLQQQQAKSQAKESDLKAIQSRLTALKTAADALSAASTWKGAQTVDSSDPSHIGATLLGATAAAGGTTLNVTTLAAAAQHAYDYNSAAGATISLMRGGSQVGSSVTIAAGTSIQDAAAQINSAGLDVSATVVNDNGVDTLVFAAKSTGAASAFSINGLSASANTRWERTGNDSDYTVGSDPTVRHSSTNTVDNALPGVRLTFKATTSSPVTVTVGTPGLDQDTVKSKVNDYVNAYNSLIDAVNAQTTEKVVLKPTTTAGLTAGQLFGDSGLTSLVMRMRTLTATDDGTNALDSWADLGLSTGKASATSTADAKLGKLTLDSDKLSDLLASKPDQVKTLLGGLTKQIGDYVDGQNKVIDGRVTAADNDQKSLTDQMTAMDAQLKMKQDRLEAQFAAMETALSQAQSQQSWLQGQIASLG
jgi:flagellar hook-associated protein 2